MPHSTFNGRVAASASFFFCHYNKVLDVKTPSALRKEHLPVLRRLHTVGNAVAQDLMRQGAGAVRSARAASNDLKRCVASSQMFI